MLNSFPVAVIAGILLGFLSGLGIGGGSLLVLWLTLVLDTPQDVARTVNLLFFLPSAVIASLFRWRQGSLPLKKIWPAIIAGCLSAALFSYLGGLWNVSIMKKLFGGLLLITGIRELLYKEKPQA
jgi:uncharacterized membrane protein YfcA